MRKAPIKYEVLKYLAAAGIVGAAFTVPAVFMGLSVLGITGKIAKNSKRGNIARSEKINPYAYRVVAQMKKEGLIVQQGENRGKKIGLSQKGKLLLEQLKAKTPMQEKWDKKWRILVFDVYETNRAKRNRLRNEIKEYGFIQMQQSVWVYPYQCEAFIHLLKTDLSFGKNVRYIIAEKIEDDVILKKRFRLDQP